MYTHFIGWTGEEKYGRSTGTLKHISWNIFFIEIYFIETFFIGWFAHRLISTHFYRLTCTRFAHTLTGLSSHNTHTFGHADFPTLLQADLHTIRTPFVRLVSTQFAYLLTFIFPHNFPGWLAHNSNTLKQANFRTICAHFDRLICAQFAHTFQADLHTLYRLNWGKKKQGQSTGTICTHCTGWAKRCERSMSAGRDLKVRLSCL